MLKKNRRITKKYGYFDSVKKPKKKSIFSNWARSGLTVVISVFLIVTVAKAGSLTPSASPAATSYTVEDIYNRLITNSTATEGDHIFSPDGVPAATLYTLKQIYDAIPTIDATKILTGTSYLGIAGSMLNIGQQIITPSATQQTISEGYHNGTGYVVGDADLIAGNIKSGINLFDVVGSLVEGYLYGSSVASQVLTSAGAGAGTYNANNLSTTTVKKGIAFGVSDTGAYSGYPGTGWSGTSITQATCDGASDGNWKWFEDGNGDGDTTDPEDGVCVRATPGAVALSWNGSEQIGSTPITS